MFTKEKTYGSFRGDDGNVMYRFNSDDPWYDGPKTEFIFWNKKLKHLENAKAKYADMLKSETQIDNIRGFNSLSHRIEICDTLIKDIQKRISELLRAAKDGQTWNLGMLL